MKRVELHCDDCGKDGGAHAPLCPTLLRQLKAVKARVRTDEREQAKVGASA